MSFNPNTDTNWASVSAADGLTNGAQERTFLLTFVQYMCNQATVGGGTINAVMIQSAISAAQYSAGQGAGGRNF